MKKKNLNLALFGFASISLILAGCGNTPSDSKSTDGVPDDSANTSSSDDTGNEPIISENRIKIVSPAKDEAISITPSVLADYLLAKTEPEQIKALKQRETPENVDLTCTSVKLSWEKNGSNNYVISVADNVSFNDAQTYKVSSFTSSYELYNLIPNRTYFWKVKGTKSNDVSSISTFQTTGPSVRFINASGAKNIRDLGGWKTSSGETISYGKLFRGALLNNYSNFGGLDESGIKTFDKELGINTEIDLRNGDVDDGSQTKCFFNPSKKYIRAEMGQYYRILDQENYALANGKATWSDLVTSKDTAGISYQNHGTSKKNIKAIFETLSNEDNYPIYFHCNAGADRTGTLAFLIEGLLGVSYEDLVRDFELTSFSKYGYRLRSDFAADGLSFTDKGIQTISGNYVGFGQLKNNLLEYYGDGKDDLSLAIENFLTRYIGVKSSVITSIKNILLEKGETVTQLKETQEFQMSQSSFSLDLSKANFDAGSISSISIGNISLGKDASNLSMDTIKNSKLDGEREVVVKGKIGGNDATVYVPVRFVTKLITTVDEFVALDTYRATRLSNYGYYRLANDIGSQASPVNRGGFLGEQTSAAGYGGFRGTIDGNGKKVFIKPSYAGVFSILGGGSKIFNTDFEVTQFGTTSGKNDVSAILGASMSGATLDNVTFNLLSSNWGSNYNTGLFVSGGGLIATNSAHGNLLKDVTINANNVPLVSILGGTFYESSKKGDGMGGNTFINTVLNCNKLAYVGAKASISGDRLDIGNYFLPFEIEGITGTYKTSQTNAATIKAVDDYSMVTLDSRYTKLELVKATYNGKEIKVSQYEKSIMFKTSEVYTEGASLTGTLSLDFQKGDITMNYSLPINISK